MVQRELWNNKARLSDEHGGPPWLSLVQAGCHNPIPEFWESLTTTTLFSHLSEMTYCRFGFMGLVTKGVKKHKKKRQRERQREREREREIGRAHV